MSISRRTQNLIHLVRSRAPGYVIRYYADRLRTYPVAIARASFLDLFYAHTLLFGDAPSRFGHLGARAVHHTAYDILDLIFAVAPPDPNDVLVDVGCGKGRVIIFWLHHKYGSRIVGVELDPDIAQQTAHQFRAYQRVQIVAGDAIDNLPDDGTVFYLYNPFTEEKAIEFERRAYALPTDHPVRVIYYNPNFLTAFGSDRWARNVVPLNGRLDRNTLKRFCFPVAILDRRPPSGAGT